MADRSKENTLAVFWTIPNPSTARLLDELVARDLAGALGSSRQVSFAILQQHSMALLPRWEDLFKCHM